VPLGLHVLLSQQERALCRAGREHNGGTCAGSCPRKQMRSREGMRMAQGPQDYEAQMEIYKLAFRRVTMVLCTLFQSHP